MRKISVAIFTFAIVLSTSALVNARETVKGVVEEAPNPILLFVTGLLGVLLIAYGFVLSHRNKKNKGK